MNAKHDEFNWGEFVVWKHNVLDKVWNTPTFPVCSIDPCLPERKTRCLSSHWQFCLIHVFFSVSWTSFIQRSVRHVRISGNVILPKRHVKAYVYVDYKNDMDITWSVRVMCHQDWWPQWVFWLRWKCARASFLFDMAYSPWHCISCGYDSKPFDHRRLTCCRHMLQPLWHSLLLL